MTRLCQALGCDRRHHARGLCAAHYKQWRRGHRAALTFPEPRYGSPLSGPQKRPGAAAGRALAGGAP